MIVVDCIVDEIKINMDDLTRRDTEYDNFVRYVIDRSLYLDTGVFQYAVELPDDMALTLNNQGSIDFFDNDTARVRYYLINWKETDKRLAADFKFGD